MRSTCVPFDLLLPDIIVDKSILCFDIKQHLNAFDRAMNLLDDRFHFLASAKQVVSSTSEEDKVGMNFVGHLILVLLS